MAVMDDSQDYGDKARALHRDLSDRWRGKVKEIDFKWSQCHEWESRNGGDGTARFRITTLDGSRLFESVTAPKKVWETLSYEQFWKEYRLRLEKKLGKASGKEFEELIAAGDVE